MNRRQFHFSLSATNGCLPKAEMTGSFGLYPILYNTTTDILHCNLPPEFPPFLARLSPLIYLFFGKYTIF